MEQQQHGFIDSMPRAGSDKGHERKNNALSFYNIINSNAHFRRKAETGSCHNKENQP